jgi:hypothetical protein
MAVENKKDDVLVSVTVELGEARAERAFVVTDAVADEVGNGNELESLGEVSEDEDQPEAEDDISAAETPPPPPNLLSDKKFMILAQLLTNGLQKTRAFQICESSLSVQNLTS